MKNGFAKYTAGSLVCVGLLMTGSAAFAQDTMGQGGQSPGQPTQDHGRYQSTNPQATDPSQSSSSSSSTTSSTKPTKQEMKDCVARAKASDSTLKDSDAKKACHDALRAQKANSDGQGQPQ